MYFASNPSPTQFSMTFKRSSTPLADPQNDADGVGPAQSRVGLPDRKLWLPPVVWNYDSTEQRGEIVKQSYLKCDASFSVNTGTTVRRNHL